MMSVNISALGNLAPSEPLDLDTYVDAKPFQLARAGVYQFRAPTFSDASFGATRAGNLSATLDPTIVGPTNEGVVVRFCKVSAKTFERSGKQVSYAGDYLRACGIRGEVPADPQELANLIASTSGALWEGQLDWEAGKGDFRVKGMRNFPKDASGEPQSWVEHPTLTDDNGAPLRLRANLVVTRFIPKA